MIADPERLALCSSFVGELGFRSILVRAESGFVPAITATSWADVLELGSGVLRTIELGGGSVSIYEDALAASIEPESEAMVMYTSGSTGFPKGVVHTHRSVGTAMKVGEMSKVAMGEAHSVQLMAVPLFHITALMPVGLFSIVSGSKVIMLRKWDAGVALDVIQRERVSRFTGVPTMIRDLLDHPAFSPDRVKTLSGVVAGGSPVPPSQVSHMRSKAKGMVPGQGYGLTETCALGTVNRGVDYLLNPTSCGKPIPLIVEVAILDPTTGDRVATGERGEVCIRGPMVMKCYNNLPEKTAETIDTNGYFHTGDIGRIDSAGFVYILDRMKDLIIRGGENIDCSEVEAALSLHPAVRECSVFGLPDSRLGEV